jgi:hypothetical protein
MNYSLRGKEIKLMNCTNHTVSRFSAMALLFLVVGTAYPQDTGCVTGTVTETYCTGFGEGERGAAGVIVVLDELGDATLTADDGSYAFEDVAPGTYTVSFFVAGYPPFQDQFFGQARAQVTVEAGATTTLDVHLPFAVAGEILTGLAPGTTEADAQAIADAYGFTLLDYIESLNYAAYLIPQWTYTQDYIDFFNQGGDPLVLYAEPNYFVCITGGDAGGSILAKKGKELWTN